MIWYHGYGLSQVQARSSTAFKKRTDQVFIEILDIGLENQEMKPLFQLSTRSYDEEIIIVRKAMEELETKCNVKNGFLLKEPSGMAGWTFFNLELSDAMLSVIETSGMMINAQGFGFNEQLKNYLGHYLETKGSNCRIKKIDY